MFSSLSWKIGLVTTVAAASALVPTIASASNYASDSGSTLMLLDDEKWQGQYQTKINGKVWSGAITPSRVLGQNGNRAIYGTFNDAPGRVLNMNDRMTCTGDFTATQTFKNDRYIIDATWKTTGGKNCPSIGQTSRLQLVEALPVADRNGDYSFENSKAWAGVDNGQNDFHTWDEWQVVDDGLNCRARPNGKIVKTYTLNDRFTAAYDGRGIANAILGADNQQTHPSQLVPKDIKGAPWMLTKDRCYVRSNRQYIQPLSSSQSR